MNAKVNPSDRPEILGKLRVESSSIGDAYGPPGRVTVPKLTY